MCPVQRAAGCEAKDDMTEVMSDKDLLDALDPDHPGLESVGEAMSAGDLGEAKQRLIAYFRNRRNDGTKAGSPGPTDQPEVTSERGEQLCRELAARDWLSVADVPGGAGLALRLSGGRALGCRLPRPRGRTAAPGRAWRLCRDRVVDDGDRRLDGRVTVEANDLQGTPTVDGGEWIR